MKNWVLLAILAAGGYAAFEYYKKHKASPAEQGAHISTSIFSGAATDGLVSGIPTFDTTPVLNRPDQEVAAMHNNMMATIPGGSSYTPAFGPVENQSGGLPIF